MARPPRPRIVTGRPIATVYRPASVPARDLAWVNLTLDEFEAIRLIDAEGLDQEAVAAQMGLLEDEKMNRMVQALGRKLLRGVPRRNFDFQFKIVRHTVQ